MRRPTKILLAIGLIAAALWAGNTSLFSCPATKPQVIAHRGLGQTYHRERLQNDTCTAERIYPPEHSLLENTIAGFGAAFEAGADIVEFDVHPTTDGKFAVFHDWTLDCRTEASGVTREKSMAELKTLDIGYGYTADGGKTFPFRGKGVGLMPTLDEVLAAFPDKGLLIHIKSNDPADGEKLAERLKRLAPEQRDSLAVYGGHRPVSVVRERFSGITVMSARLELGCLLPYLAVGWTGYVPSSCAKLLLLVPRNYAGLLWGWPDRFLSRMRGVVSIVLVAGPYQAGEFSTGIDTADELKSVPLRADVGIWTNRADRIAPLLPAKTR
jgi:glycerophosphoryl diester phosphodiesterase